MVNCCSRSSTVWVLVEHVNTVKINIPTLNVEQKRAILLLALFRVECRYQLDDVFLISLSILCQNVASSAPKDLLQQSIDLNLTHIRIFCCFIELFIAQISLEMT